ncbi:MAG: PUR family DNA/RNA-binding protein [Bacteroidetes bacterium]|nr:PUR family DNA/RNA-binding protein [Bacteroidota bacterium]
MEENDKHDENLQNERENIYSKSVRAGKRTYFFDVKATRRDEYYLTITESKKRSTVDGNFFYEKHKIFLYKEDFEKFAEGLSDVVDYINKNNVANESDNSQADTDIKSENTSIPDVTFEDLDNKKK